MSRPTAVNSTVMSRWLGTAAHRPASGKGCALAVALVLFVALVRFNWNTVGGMAVTVALVSFRSTVELQEQATVKYRISLAHHGSIVHSGQIAIS